jgi:ATP-dependent Clp protease ATP-binding subunit ClpC
MFDRYTEKARRTIFFARYEASQYGASYIETEYLLLGLLHEDRALTHRLLLTHESAESIRKRIEEVTISREKVSTSVDMPLSNESKRALAYAAEEAERLSHKHIGTEHLLLGLLREQRCTAAVILNDIGIDLEKAREIATSMVGESAARTESTAGIIQAKGVGSIEFRCGNDLIAALAVHVLSPTPRIGEKVAFRNKEGEHVSYRVEDVKYIYVSQLPGTPITRLLSKVIVEIKREQESDH